jgi:uncharacterized repeat protein (TIGR01451 family)
VVDTVLTYTITATNTGNVSLTGVEISDDTLDSPLSCVPAQPATLAPNATLVCTGTYTVTQDDVNAGQVVNEASVTSDQEAEDTATETVTITRDADISLDKELTGQSDDPIVVDTVLTYTITATNTGNVSLTGVEISDDTLDAR